MAFSDWYPIKNVPIDSSRRADGKWRIEYDELVTRLRVSSNGYAYSDWVAAGLELDSYRALAERVVVEINTRH